MVQACPINSETVNNRVVRLVALQVVVLAAVFLVRPTWWLFAALAADFLVRALGQRAYSPLAFLGRTIAAALELTPQPVNAAPKQFAASIGVGFALVAGALALLGFTPAARVVAGGLLGAASLEAVAGFCVGCKIYQLIPRRASASAQPTS
jgi:hypothetical protein